MRSSWAVSLWPGLPRLWCRGAWSGLAVAVGFSLLLNGLLLCSLVWTELLSPGLLRFAWCALCVVWCGTTLASLWNGPPPVHQPAPGPSQDLFRPALNEYLRGNWIAAERNLTRLLADDAGDVDARLLLAALLRRTARYDEAERELRRLEGYERATKWRLEIAAERRWLAQARERAGEANESRVDQSQIASAAA